MQRRCNAALVCAALIALTGCGSDDGAAPAADRQATTPTSTEPVTDQGTGDVEPTTSGTSDRHGDGTDDLASTLAGRTFLSTDVDGHSLVAGTQISLTFQRDSVGATAGCNSLGFDATYDDGILTVSGGMQTEMGCSDELEAQDRWLSGFMRSQPTVAIDGDTLTVAGPDTVITLVDREIADPDRPLVGTTWIVDGLISSAAVSSVPDGSAASITIVDGSAAVHTGCNRGNAAVDVDDTTITFSPMATTKMACAPALMELEFAVTSALTGEVSYEIEAGRLTITRRDQNGETIGLTLTAE